MKEILKDIFTKPYQGKSFVLDSLLKPLLGDYKPSNEDILHNSERKKLAEKANVKAITRIAEFELEDTTLQVFDITLSSHSKIKYSKVNIQKVVRSIMDVYTGAIMFFHYENNEGDWRISFVEKEDSQKNTTSAKRYTFLVGENHPATTITQRFVTLRGKEKSVEAIRDAFSVEALSEEFFTKYKSHYEDFVQYISGKRFVKEKGKWVEKSIGQPSEEYISIFEENDKSVRDFVKKMLGRIVFLHFLQKKKWLCDDENYLQNLFKKSEKSNYLESILEPLFFGVLNTKSEDRKVLFENENWDLSLLKEWENIPYLNGGLFEKDELDKKTVIFPEGIFSDLFDFFSQYNFTIDENDPNDSEVGIDPEMLGKIFENLLEDNKDKGAFYTPKEIVQYMCRESLIAYLCEKHKDDEENIRNLVEHHIANWNEDKRNKILDSLKNVKICDPAIGSGAFPMGLLNELYQCRLALGEEKSVNIKKEIIQNNIYGVDIEKGAVDIARLRFWLALVVEEEIAEPLPNLDYKIMQGNSLLESYQGVDLSNIGNKKGYNPQRDLFGNIVNSQIKMTFAKSKLSQEIQELIQKYYDFKGNSENKKTAQDKINKKIYEHIDYNLELRKNELERQLLSITPKYKGEKLNDKQSKEIKKITEKINELSSVRKELFEIQQGDDRPYFLWRLYFADVFKDGGFDIIIGNPPYIKEYENKSVFNGFRDSEFYIGKMDIWYAFVSIGLNLLKDNAVLSFIAQNNWTTSAGAKLLRKDILQRAKIEQFIDFGNYKVFESAAIQTMIFLLRKTIDNKRYKIQYSLLQDEKIDKKQLKEFLIFNMKNDFAHQKFLYSFKAEKFIDKTFNFTNSDIDVILDKIEKKGAFKLNSDEVANGIHAHYDFVNKKIQSNFPNLVNGQGIFGLSEVEKQNLNLTKEENILIKPYYTSEQFSKYFANSKNKFWIIYTNSDFKNPEKIKLYPNIKNHLDKFKNVITSDNKPYGLHRARNESFFIGEKIITLRKSPDSPQFYYTDFDCYVSATFYVIKTNRINQKYLTLLLNSKLIEFWLRHKGKMQGDNFQLDKEPILTIPIVQITNENYFTDLYDKIVCLKKRNQDSSSLEKEINILIYKLYDLSFSEIQSIDGTITPNDFQ